MGLKIGARGWIAFKNNYATKEMSRNPLETI